MDREEAKQRIFEIVLKKLLKEVEIDLDLLNDIAVRNVVNYEIYNIGHAASYITSNLMQWSPIEEDDEDD